MLQYLWTRLRATIKSEKGQDLAEYALLIALIAIVVIIAVMFLGTAVGNAFNKIAANITF